MKLIKFIIAIPLSFICGFVGFGFMIAQVNRPEFWYNKGFDWAENALLWK